MRGPILWQSLLQPGPAPLPREVPAPTLTWKQPLALDDPRLQACASSHHSIRARGASATPTPLTSAAKRPPTLFPFLRRTCQSSPASKYSLPNGRSSGLWLRTVSGARRARLALAQPGRAMRGGQAGPTAFLRRHTVAFWRQWTNVFVFQGGRRNFGRIFGVRAPGAEVVGRFFLRARLVVVTGLFFM